MNNSLPHSCDNCTKPTNQLELYVVPGNMEYLFYCKNCFDHLDEQKYFSLVRDGYIHNIFSEQEFNHHKLDTVPIGFSRGAIVDDKAILPPNFEDAIVKEIEGEFLNNKVHDKFIIKSHRSVIKRLTPNYYNVTITAICQHKSYKQFLEHELYMHMRKEVNFTAQ